MLNKSRLRNFKKTVTGSFIIIIFTCGVFQSASVENVFAEKLNNLSDLNNSPKINKYLYSRAQQKDMFKVGLYWDKKLGLSQGCKEGREVIAITLMLLEPIDFPEDKAHPVAGVWQHRFAFKRCGEQKIYNAIFVANKGERPKIAPYFPGTTSTSTLLLHDAMTSVMTSALLKIRELNNQEKCNNVELIDTLLKKSPHDVIENGITTKGVWNEEWTLRGCGQTVKVPIIFSPDGSGGTTFIIKTTLPPAKDKH